MTFKTVKGGFALTEEDERLLNVQKAITGQINNKFVTVGATFLKPSSKFPVDEDWFKKLKGDVDLQSWIDSEELQPLNVGFNLQQGWCDVDIDASDPEFNNCVLSAFECLGLDVRFKFGRASVGVATHILIQLPEDESRNFDELRRFEPREFRIGDKRYHVQLRSFPTGVEAKNLVKSAKQTVVPGSVYAAKHADGKDYDVSVWYGGDRSIATNVSQIADTTPRKCSFTDIVRAVAFGTILYTLRDHWVEGSRQTTAQKITGWLARVVEDSQGINNHESLSNDVFCPIDSDSIAEKLLRFICDFQQDDEAFMRVRAYYDAREKLSRNPDAKIPGWHSIQELVGPEYVMALRSVVMPGADVSKLTQFVDRYVYDETDNKYIDRQRHASFSIYCHDGADLERRHKGDIIFVGGKPREAFKVFESSALRKRVGYRDMFPDLSEGSIYRIDTMGSVVPDETEGTASTVFNTWRGWPIGPATVVEPDRMNMIVERLDKLLGYLTCDNASQIDWAKKWIAWIFQNPGRKQQIAWVVLGGQGVGKSFFGNVFMRALLTERLWGSASPKILDQKFTISPFKDKMFVFIDEASFHGNAGAVDEVKKLIRNTEMNGMEKFEEARDYRIFARLMFAANRFDINISDRDVRDRALFYSKAYSEKHMAMTEIEFRKWAETLKPWFDEFEELLKERANLEHYIRYFMDMEVTRHELESIKHSSSNDADVAAGNMSWARRITKTIVESGWIAADDLAWEVPFDQRMLAARVLQECKDQGMPTIRPDGVRQELERANLIEMVTFPGGNKAYRSIYKWGETLHRFTESSSLELTPYREPNPETDYGINTEEPGSRKERPGTRLRKF